MFEGLYQENYVEAGDNRLCYYEVGNGPVLIFLHGSGPGVSGLSNFYRNIDYFSKDFRVIVFDLPGFGKSSKPVIPIERLFAYFADTVRSAMDALGIDKAHFIGNSLGGAVALRVALDEPAKVDRLVLMGSGGGVPIITAQPAEGIRHLINYYDGEGPTREKLREFINVMVYDPSQVDDELFEYRYQASIDPEVVANPLFNRSRIPGAERLFPDVRDVHQKTLIVWGRDDRTMTLDQSFFMLAQMPDVQLHVFGQCGHWSQWERADEFNVLVQGFLTGK